MGCDIHAVIERRNKTYGDSYEWLHSGDPDIGRDYEMFAVLAGVRNYDGIVPISEPRGLPGFIEFKTHNDGERWARWSHQGDVEPPSYEFRGLVERYGEDGHSGSWVTLAEIKAYDTAQTVNDRSLIVGRKGDAVTMTARSSTVAGLGAVGVRRVLTWPGEEEPTAWLRLIRYMEQAKWDGQSDDEIRLVFFFDN